MLVAGVLDVDGTLAARCSLGFEDLALLNAKPAGTRLGFAAQLTIYRTAGRFARAASEFAEAAIKYLAEQVGAAVAVFRHGRPVVDLWGGHLDAARGLPWKRDTIVPVFSTSKGVAALVLASLRTQPLADAG